MSTTSRIRLSRAAAPSAGPFPILLRGLLASSVLLVPLAACGSDDDPSAGADTFAEAADDAPAPDADVSAGDVAAGDIEVRATDYAYLGLPEQIRAGSTLTLTNVSEVEVHELVAIKLPDDETRSAADLAQLPPGELEAFLPEVRTVVIAPPAAPGMAVVGDGSLTEPGRYFLVCVIPTGADPDEYLAAAANSDGPPEVAGGPPHLVEGMFGEVTVVE